MYLFMWLSNTILVYCTAVVYAIKFNLKKKKNSYALFLENNKNALRRTKSLNRQYAAIEFLLNNLNWLELCG